MKIAGKSRRRKHLNYFQYWLVRYSNGRYISFSVICAICERMEQGTLCARVLEYRKHIIRYKHKTKLRRHSEWALHLHKYISMSVCLCGCVRRIQ